MVYRGFFLSRCLFYKSGCSTVWRTKTKQVINLLPRRFHRKTNFCFAGYDDKAIRTKLKPLGTNGEVILKKLDPQRKGIAVISISNHQRKNAMTGSMMVQLAEIVDELETWNEGTAVILHGKDGTFCSGADLTFAKTILTPEQGKEMCSLMHNTLRRLGKLPMISVAAIEGRALGGGAEVRFRRLVTGEVQSQ